MKHTLMTHEIMDLLKRDTQFSYQERKALAEFYEQLEDDIGETIEYDGVAIRCSWNSYSDLGALGSTYGTFLNEYLEQHDQEFKFEVTDEFLEWLQSEHGFYILKKEFGENDYGWQDDHPQGWMILVAEYI